MECRNAFEEWLVKNFHSVKSGNKVLTRIAEGMRLAHFVWGLVSMCAS